MRRRTPKQTAVFNELVVRGALRPTEVVAAGSGSTFLPWSEGTARDTLQALVRRGDAVRLPGRPARYEATPRERAAGGQPVDAGGSA